jgi:OOP family OmpA-OmpF porin
MNMNRSVKLSAAVALAVLGMGAATAAEGVYLGGALTQSRFDSDNFTVDDIDDEDLGWKILGGFRLSPNFAFEAAFTDFGESNAPALAAGGPFEAKAEALSAFALGMFPAGPVDLFLKAGAARIKAEGNVGAVFFEDKEIEFAYGGGVQFNIGRLGLRAEYEKFDTDVIGDLDVISLGFNFTFGAD